ncbi:hypothetical protein I309_03656 [Cryptococcus deuterogattii LA55]|nr:hypothetical protein I309_03656 [Cryptococcus deuterogattii LA55]KIR90329.1 hypothetical protein I304_05906 [Cryptococcus deuterogattii CBS 10090]
MTSTLASNFLINPSPPIPASSSPNSVFQVNQAPYSTSVSPPLQLPGGRLTTPLAPPPPPPLHLSSHRHGPGPERQIRYAGADHTLGPTFSEEEDGDDSAFIAAKMAALGLDPNGVPYSQNGYSGSHSTRAPRAKRSRTPTVPRSHQQVGDQQYAQQQALLSLLAHQGSSAQVREALALLELQQAQQAATDRHYHTQMTAQHHARLAAQRQAEKQAEYEKQLYVQQQMQQKLLEQLAIQREATKRQFQQQQEEQYMLQQRGLQQLHLQQQFAALQTDSYVSQAQAQHQRSALRAQMQANLQARSERAAQANWAIGVNEADLKSRFESAMPIKSSVHEDHSRFETGVYGTHGASTSSSSSGSPTSPSWPSAQLSSPTKSIWGVAEVPMSSKTAPGGRFAQARLALAASGTSSYGTLTATLSKRSFTEDQTTLTVTEVRTPPDEMSRTTPASPTTQLARQSIGLSLDRPAASVTPIEGKITRDAADAASARTFSLSFGGPHCSGNDDSRSSSQPVGLAMKKISVTRQPSGPPGDVKDLDDRNFQARIRKQVGLNLGMLNRRTESPAEIASTA